MKEWRYIMDEINKVTLSKIHDLIEETVENMPTEEREELIAHGYVEIDPRDLMDPDSVTSSRYELQKRRAFNLSQNVFPLLLKNVVSTMLQEGIVFKNSIKQVEAASEIVFKQLAEMHKRFGRDG
jgi:hypothetical protein